MLFELHIVLKFILLVFNTCFFQGTQKCSQLLLVGIIPNFTAPQQEAIEAVGFGKKL
jgi:hypothetical protein